MCIAYPVQIFGVLHLRYSVYCANFNRKRISDCLGMHVSNFIDDGDVVSRKNRLKNIGKALVQHGVNLHILSKFGL